MKINKNKNSSFYTTYSFSSDEDNSFMSSSSPEKNISLLNQKNFQSVIDLIKNNELVLCPSNQKEKKIISSALDQMNELSIIDRKKMQKNFSIKFIHKSHPLALTTP